MIVGAKDGDFDKALALVLAAGDPKFKDKLGELKQATAEHNAAREALASARKQIDEQREEAQDFENTAGRVQAKHRDARRVEVTSLQKPTSALPEVPSKFVSTTAHMQRGFKQISNEGIRWIFVLCGHLHFKESIPVRFLSLNRRQFVDLNYFPIGNPYLGHHGEHNESEKIYKVAAY